MSEDIFANIPREGETLDEVLDSVDKELQDVVDDTKPAESQPEKVEKVELPDEAHFLKQNERWEQMRKDNESLQARLEQLEKERDLEVTPEKSDFVKSLVGDNDEVAEQWAKEKEKLAEEIKQKLVQEQLDAEKAEKEQAEYWNKWTEERLDEVGKEFKVDFKANESLKNELSKVMLEYSPTDEQGNLDYRKGMKILNELSKVKEEVETQKTQVKKNIADATVSKETTVQKNKGFLTSNDFRGRDWRSMVHGGE